MKKHHVDTFPQCNRSFASPSTTEPWKLHLVLFDQKGSSLPFNNLQKQVLQPMEAIAAGGNVRTHPISWIGQGYSQSSVEEHLAAGKVGTSAAEAHFSQGLPPGLGSLLVVAE